MFGKPALERTNTLFFLPPPPPQFRPELDFESEQFQVGQEQKFLRLKVVASLLDIHFCFSILYMHVRGRVILAYECLKGKKRRMLAGLNANTLR